MKVLPSQYSHIYLTTGQFILFTAIRIEAVTKFMSKWRNSIFFIKLLNKIDHVTSTIFFTTRIP